MTVLEINHMHHGMLDVIAFLLRSRASTKILRRPATAATLGASPRNGNIEIYVGVRHGYESNKCLNGTRVKYYH